jgi:hypothetical protein
VTSVAGHIFIYGPIETSIEQINSSTDSVTYLHHDQAGSTPLLTGSAGTVTGKCSYNGTPSCEGSATTRLATTANTQAATPGSSTSAQGGRGPPLPHAPG